MCVYRFLLFMFPCFSWASQVSYHMFDEAVSGPVVCTNIENKEELEREMNKCDLTFQRALCTHLQNVARCLTPDYRRIFFGGKNEISKQLSQEEESLCSEETMLDDQAGFEELANRIISERRGLPKAALSLGLMYENQGLCREALLWAYVACKLGFDQGRSLASRMFLLLSC